MATIVSYGGGRCAVCQCKTRAGFLMCGKDWGRVPAELQSQVYWALHQWNANQISLADLRAVQDRAIAVSKGEPDPGDPTEPHDPDVDV